MGKIVAIGGITPPLTLDSIDEEVIKLTKKTNPKVLYIPAAGGDDIRYCEFFRSLYQCKFGCKVDVLFLVKETPIESEIKEKVFSSDIIYVEGGSVSRLMEYFERFNMDKILKEAYEKGIILAGKSAGALCFGQFYFESENTINFKIDGFNDYIQVDCLKILDLIICPHYNLEGSSENLDTMINAYNIVGIALDNDCAIEFVDDSYRIISTIDSANAYKVYKNVGKIHKEAILKSSSFRDINELMSLS